MSIKMSFLTVTLILWPALASCTNTEKPLKLPFDVTRAGNETPDQQSQQNPEEQAAQQAPQDDAPPILSWSRLLSSSLAMGRYVGLQGTELTLLGFPWGDFSATNLKTKQSTASVSLNSSADSTTGFPQVFGKDDKAVTLAAPDRYTTNISFIPEKSKAAFLTGKMLQAGLDDAVSDIAVEQLDAALKDSDYNYLRCPCALRANGSRATSECRVYEWCARMALSSAINSLAVHPATNVAFGSDPKN